MRRSRGPELTSRGGTRFFAADLSVGTSRVLLAVLLVAYLALAVTYSLVTPIYEPTDEIRHVRYVRHLAVYRRLPVQTAEGPRAQSHHPPLYYALGALVSGWVAVEQDVYYEPPRNPHWTNRYEEVGVDNKNQYLHSGEEGFPFRGITLVIYLVRWMTVAIGALTVWLTYRLGRRTVPGRPAIAWGGAALVAFTPQFLHLSGAVNNDIPAALWGVGILLMCVDLVQRGPNTRSDVSLGIMYGLALMTKFHLLALAAPIILAYVIRVRSSRDWGAFLRGMFTVVGLAVLISGWWFWRNYALYGDPTGMTKVSELWAGRSPGGNWWALRQGLPHLWSSLWGRFGYGQIPLHQPVYQALLAFSVFAMAGYLIPRPDSLPADRLSILGITVLVFLAAVFYYILIQPAGAMGRFLFPALPAFSLLVTCGLSRFFPDRLTDLVGLGVGLGAGILAIYALVSVLGPAYAHPRSLAPSEIASVPNPTDTEFGAKARLLGYEIAPRVVEPGDTMKVTLYWEALSRTERNYVVFVHVLSDVGTMIAQRDTYPGLGRYPTTTWEPGVAFADTYRVRVPETAYAPDSGYVQVGLYLPDGARLATRDGRDAVRLGTVEVEPRPGDFPNRQEVNFGDRIELVGYKLDRRVVRPGDEIQLTLYWRALAAMKVDYHAFAHILGAENQIWANSDSLLLDGAAATSQWQPGQVIEEVRELSVTSATPPDFYDIEVGVHAVGRGRLPILAEGGHQRGNRVLLSKVRVEDE